MKVELINLEKDYEGFHLELSMEIPEGSVTGLIGKNGAGKSTVIKSILGLIRPSAGKVLINGIDAGSIDREMREKIGVTLADSFFSEYLSVRDIAGIMEGMYRQFDRTAFLAACRRFGLSENKLIREYSTGMKAKLRVLTALSHKAELLIMDEPTVGLDIEARNEILDMLREYLAEDETRSILISSHIATDLEGLCDRVLLIGDGKILLGEDTDRILSDYGILRVNEAVYGQILQAGDLRYVLSESRTSYGYDLLTDEMQYFVENYPAIVIEHAGIDDLILRYSAGKERA